MAQSIHPSAERHVLHEFFEFLLNCFHGDGAVRNEWLMPFDPGPSSFPRNQDRRRPAVRRRRPF